MSSLTLHRAPYDRSLQYAMVQLPASGAERALQVRAAQVALHPGGPLLQRFVLHGRRCACCWRHATLVAAESLGHVQELNGLIVYELSGDMELIVKQSKRSLKPLIRWQQEQQRRQAGVAQRAERAAARPNRGAVDAEGLEVECEDGSVAPLQGPVRRIKQLFVCEGPPSRMLWVGSIGGHATAADVTATFRRHAAALAGKDVGWAGWEWRVEEWSAKKHHGCCCGYAASATACLVTCAAHC